MVIIIGLENILIIVKAVISTPEELEVNKLMYVFCTRLVDMCIVYKKHTRTYMYQMYVCEFIIFSFTLGDCHCLWRACINPLQMP